MAWFDDTLAEGVGRGGQCYNTVNMSLRKVGMGSDNFK